MMGDGSVNLPPGFRFSPTDEELVVHFLHRKASLLPCHPDIIPDLGLHRPLDPWDLDGGGHWYFFGRKMDNQITENGFWKTVEMERPICIDGGHKKVGIRKSLVYSIGVPPTGTETDWVMLEYHLCNNNRATITSSHRRRNNKLDLEWVLRRVYQQKPSSRQTSVYNVDNDYDDGGSELSCLDEMFLSLDDALEDINMPDWTVDM